MKGFLIVALTLLLAGCVSSGNRSLDDASQESVSSSIVEGQTTKQEVQEAFGGPIASTFGEDGKEVWIYTLSNISADARSFIPFVGLFGQSGSGTQKNLMIMFDRSDVVDRYTFTESDVGYGTGVFQ